MGQVDDAEPVALGVSQHDEVGVEGIAVPVDPAGPERDQAVELWTWSFNPQERAAIAAIPGVAGIADLVPPVAPGIVPVTLRAVRLLPRRVRYALPVFPVLQVRFR